MYKVYNKELFLGEVNTFEEVDFLKTSYYNKIKAEISKELNIIKEIEILLKNIFPKPEAMTNEKYLEFLENNFPELISLLNKLKDLSKEEVIGIYVNNPKLTDMGLKVKSENRLGYKLVNLNNIYLKLKSMLPSEYTFRVEEV